jgi:hypothetical protein
LQTDSLQATLSLLHRSRLEIEKAQTVIEQGADRLTQQTCGRAGAGPTPLTPRRAAYVKRLVDNIFKRAVQKADDPLTLTVHQSRLEQEKVSP